MALPLSSSDCGDDIAVPAKLGEGKISSNDAMNLCLNLYLSGFQSLPFLLYFSAMSVQYLLLRTI